MMESAASAGAAASSSAMSLSTSTVSLSTESTRNPRRLSVPSRMVIGLDESFAGELESDEEHFFGSDEEQEVSTSSPGSSDDDAASIVAPEEWSSDNEEEAAAEGAAVQAGQPDVDVTEDNISAMQKDLDKGCDCADVDHLHSLPVEELDLHRKTFRKLTPRERDLYICGILANASRSADRPLHSGKSQDKDRERITYEYSVMCHHVCRSAFLTVYCIGRTHLIRLRNLISKKVFFPAPHGNVGRAPFHALPNAVLEHAVRFIRNYASVHGLPIPAAPRGRAQDAPTYLPASTTFVSVHAEYKAAAQAADLQVMGCKSFTGLWHKKCADVKFMKPREDVCAYCEAFRADSAAAKSEEERVKWLTEWQQHIKLAQDERAFYNSCTVKAIDVEKACEDEPTYSHLIFDFAENFTLPYHARQPGPVYFKVLLRVNDFGIMNGGRQRQHHYLYTEAQCIGPDNTKSHGPNNVISLLYHYLESQNHARTLHFHCDNCVGQNKYKSLMAYMALRILTAKEDEITVSFMVVGHTRCAVDGGFGLAKKKFRASDTDTYTQLAKLVSDSAVLNESCVSTEWEWRDWDTFLQEHFKKVAGITKHHHFFFSATQKGVVTMKATCREDDPVIAVPLLKDTSKDHVFLADSLPPVIAAGGMSVARRDYLEKNVMPFCRPENREAFKEMLQ